MDGEREEINPNAMTAEQAAILFSKLSHRQVPVDQIRADIEAGAPTDSAGRLNVLNYAAWLLQSMQRER